MYAKIEMRVAICKPVRVYFPRILRVHFLFFGAFLDSLTSHLAPSLFLSLHQLSLPSLVPEPFAS
jgi:hypothetical protein